MDDLVQTVYRWYRDADKHSTDWRNKAQESYDFYAGHQWSDDDKAQMDKDKRPVVTFNRIARIVNAVVGSEINNRQQTQFLPRTLGDTQIDEILTAAASWVRDEGNVEDEESDAFQDLAITGMGWTETRMDYESDLDGMPRTERADPLEFWWDPSAKKKNLSDARWRMRIKSYSQDEFDKDWPDKVVTPGAPWDSIGDELSSREHTYPQDAYRENRAQSGSPDAGKIKVVQVQWWEFEKVYRVGQQALEFSEAKFKKLKSGLDSRGIDYVSQKKKVFKQAFIAGGTVLEEGPAPDEEDFTLNCMTGSRDRNSNLWYGIVEVMKDPQRFGNKFFSTILDILNKNSKGGVMYEADAVEDARKFEEDWARPDAATKVNPGALQESRIQPKPAINFPSGLDKLMQFSMDAVHDLPGVSLELLGMANRDQANSLEFQRKQAGVTILAHLFDAQRKYRKEQGRVLLYFITRYISDGRLIRIIGEEGQAQYVPLIKQPDTLKYDVVVDEAPSSPNMKERVFSVISNLLPSLGRMNIPLPPELLDYSPLPSSLVQKWKALIKNGQQLPEEAQKHMEELQQQLQKTMQENASLKDKRQETAMKLQTDAHETQSRLALKKQEIDQDFALEQYKFEKEMELERMKAQAQIETEVLKIAGPTADIENIVMNAIKQMMPPAPKVKRIVPERDEQGIITGINVEHETVH